MRYRCAVISVLALILAGTSGIIGLALWRITLPDTIGSVFAVEVIEIEWAEAEGCRWARYASTAPKDLLGAPPADKVRNDSPEFVPLGDGGFVVVRMGSQFTNADGVDLRVYATPHQGYGTYNVSVSADAESWVEVANRVRSDRTNVWYKSIEFGSLEGTFEYVRIDAIRGMGCPCSPYIVAIEATHPCEAAPPP